MNKSIDITKLKEVTFGVMKKLRSAEVIMPCFYSNAFREEVILNGLNPDDIDLFLEEDANKEMLKNLNIAKETEKLLSDTCKIMSASNEAIKNRDEESLSKAEDEIQNLIKKISEMSKEVFNDELTGIYNRKWFFKEYLQDERFAKTNGVISFVDMNKLKFINDSYGHKIGDKAIIYLSNFIAKNLEHSHFIRYAGDEFIIIFENEDIYEVEMKLFKLNEKLSALKLKTVFNNKDVFLKLSFSFGSEKFHIDQDMTEAIEAADNNMYTMKTKK
jgi:diguanylate cyclase (GGDEF)-like protein